jgi:16S rRNA G966 N2-methylase RsmD
MNPESIRQKFDGDFVTNERTFKIGIDHRFTDHFARRFQGKKVLETCTGAGFTTIALARYASRVTTVEIDPVHQDQAKENARRAGLADRITFILGDVMNETILGSLPPVDAALLDPDWADTAPGHKYLFLNSNTQPPADALFERIRRITQNIAMILPPLVVTSELAGLPAHEREKVCFGEKHELYCLYFGEFISSVGPTTFSIPV